MSNAPCRESLNSVTSDNYFFFSKSIMKLVLGPIRSQDVRNALDKMPKDNATQKRAVVKDDDWAKLSFDYDENDK